MSDLHPHSSLPARVAIAKALREDILRGAVSSGDRLVEPDLARRFGVSRVPIREALTQLQSEGFVTLVRYRGATVSSRSLTDARELVQVRRGLEVLAAQLAADNRGGDAAAAFTRVVELGRQAGHARDLDVLPPLILEFHSLVAAASGNAQLQVLLDQTLERVAWVFDQHLDERTDDSWNSHVVIAAAILNGSPIQAGLLMSEHIAKDEEFLQQLQDVPSSPRVG